VFVCVCVRERERLVCMCVFVKRGGRESKSEIGTEISKERNREAVFLCV
jgi:hypothetical protein